MGSNFAICFDTPTPLSHFFKVIDTKEPEDPFYGRRGIGRFLRIGHVGVNAGLLGWGHVHGWPPDL